jgi:type IV pilus assembly protein PilX
MERQNRTTLNRSAPSHQHGAVLVVALLLLLVMTILVVAMVRTQTAQERMAQNDHNSRISIQAAEATLRWVELGIAKGNYVGFASGSTGLYQLDPANPTNILTLPSSSKLTYAGPTLSSGAIALSSPPLYVIEKLPAVATGGTNAPPCQYGCSPQPFYYRITAYSSGADTSSQTILQSLYQSN